MPGTKHLPFNRGAHPLFWSAHDGTPAGVTIHEIDVGVDTGPICYQRKIEIDQERETFATGYGALVAEMEALFEAHALELLSGQYVSRPQVGAGSVKRVRDLPTGFAWSEIIAPTIARLKGLQERGVAPKPVDLYGVPSV
ncbi:formyltransferase family protein [Ferirhizobium litorale]|uniref:formyltransferase family protein n=1 Tax=Ferirhizobium litorale TaxID=2927786 RepID=UPI00353002AC